MQGKNITLGGERLGTGAKMKQFFHNFERSTHDLSRVFRTTMSPGTLVPFYNRVALPEDSWDITLDAYVNTHPTVGPLFGSYKLQCDMFIIPMRLYNSILHNNTLGIGRDMTQVKMPQIRMTAPGGTIDALTKDIDNCQINPSSLLKYLGLSGIGFNPTVGPVNRDFNATSILGYWEVVKYYYANKQEEIAAVIHAADDPLEDVDQIRLNADIVPEATATGNLQVQDGDTLEIHFSGGEPDPTTIVFNTDQGLKTAAEIFGAFSILAAGTLISDPYAGTWGPITLIRWRLLDSTDIVPAEPRVVTFPLDNIDEMKRAVLSLWNTTTALVINGPNLAPYAWLYSWDENDRPFIMNSQEGLAVKTYQSDLFNNWLKTENIESLISSTAIDTSGGSFTWDQLVFGSKLYKELMRVNMAGGTYDDWMDVIYMGNRYKRIETPAYIGGLVKEVIFQEVISNTETETQPLGTLAGKGTLAQGQKGGRIDFKVDEHSIVMGIVSLTPRLNYSQGNEAEMHLKTWNDFHRPTMDEIGFQDLITEQLAWWDTSWDGLEWVTKSAGKQPAWVNYMTDVNKVYGNFAVPDNEMFMILNRRYQADSVTGAITDLTTYIDPKKFNFIFADTSIDAMNFWVQIGIKAIVRRKMSAKAMPNI